MTGKELHKHIHKNLGSIREVIDSDLIGCDTESLIELAHKMTMMVGKAAEMQAQAKKLLELKRLDVFAKKQHEKVSPSILIKILDAECNDEAALYEYSQRISAGLSHAMDMTRSIISYRKTELEKEFNNGYQ